MERKGLLMMIPPSYTSRFIVTNKARFIHVVHSEASNRAEKDPVSASKLFLHTVVDPSESNLFLA